MEQQPQLHARRPCMLLDVGERLLGHAKQHGVHFVRQADPLTAHSHRKAHRAVVAELLPQVLQRRRQAQHVELGGTQAMRDVAHLVQCVAQPAERLGQRDLRRRLFVFHLRDRRLEQQLDRHQRLAGAVVQLARQVSALVLLRLDDLAGEQAQLGFGDARIAQVQREPAAADQGDAQ